MAGEKVNERYEYQAPEKIQVPASGDFDCFCELAVRKTINSLLRGKAPGLGTSPVEAPQQPPILLKPLTPPLYCVAKAGSSPRPLAKVYGVSLDKPNKDGALCE